MKYNNKDVYSFNMWDHTRNISRNTDYSPIQRRYWGYGDILYLGKIDKTKFKYEQDAPPESTFLFDKYSEFPRTKLQYTKFKRCIKQDKADFIVVNSSIDHVSNINAVLLKINDKYVIAEDIYRNYNSVDSFISSLNRYHFESIEKIYAGDLSATSSRNSWMIKVVTGEYTKPIITDAVLTKLVNKEGEGLTEDIIMQVADMLKSSDKEVNKLGLVTLCGFNTDEYKQTLKFLLEYYPNWKNIDGKGVLIDNLVDSLQVSPRYVSNGVSLINTVFNTQSETSKDSELIKKLVYPLYIQQIEKILATNFWGKYVPKVKITIEEDDTSS